MGHDHAKNHDSHDDHHIQVFPESFKQRLEWLITPANPKSLRDRLIEFLFHSHHHHPHAYDITKIDESDHDKNINRVVFALEKLAALNHHAFTESERRVLTPTRIGMIQKAYLAALYVAPAAFVGQMFIAQNFRMKSIVSLFGFLLLSKYVLQPAPHYFKEKIRLMKARNLAGKYYRLRSQKFDDFRMILDPKTPLEYLAHYTLSV